MNKFAIKQHLRKVRWATEHATGKRLGKKGLIEVQKVVMQMTSIGLPEPAKANWKGQEKSQQPSKLTVDLTRMIGRKF